MSIKRKHLLPAVIHTRVTHLKLATSWHELFLSGMTSPRSDANHVIDLTSQSGAAASSAAAAQETETERMVRLGEMTPFGTDMRAPPPPSSAPPSTLSSFEQYLLDQSNASRQRRADKSRGGRRRDSLASPRSTVAASPRSTVAASPRSTVSVEPESSSQQTSG